jgi:hypothetical protein
MVRAMLRTLVVAVIAVVLFARPGSAPAHGKHKGKLECALASEPKKKLPIKGPAVRLVDPIKCTISTTAAEPHKVSLQTRWEDEGKKTGPKHDGEVAADKPLEVALEPDKDFNGCASFTVEAKLLDDGGKVVWKSSIVQRQECVD